MGNHDYLLDTWHADYRPTELNQDDSVRWMGLEIIASEQQLTRASVEFEACLLASGKVSLMHEHSEFVHLGGRWLYTTGRQLTPSREPWKPARNEPCPCGSGIKFKRCCGRG